MAVSAVRMVFRVCSQRVRGFGGEVREEGGGAQRDIFSMGEWARRERGR